MSKEALFDAVIIGAGPAGMIAIHELANLKIAVIEKGSSIGKRAAIISGKKVAEHAADAEVEGIAGAGGWSDGKLCLGPVGILDQFLGHDYDKEVELVNKIFKKILGSKYRLPDDKVGSTKFSKALVQEVTMVANLGTSTVRLAFQRIHAKARKTGVKFFLEDPAMDINEEKGVFIVKTKGGKILYAKNVIVATGKCDITLVPKLVNKFHLKTIPTIPTLGFRIIVPRQELAQMKSFGNNPKLKYRLPNGDKVKTHCFTFQGEIIGYACDRYTFVGGRADSEHLTDYATVAILYKFSSDSAPKVRKKMLYSTLNAINKAYPHKLIYQDMLSFMEAGKKQHKTSLPLPKIAVLGNLIKYYPKHIVNATRAFITNLSTTYGMDIKKGAIVGPAAEWISDAIATSLEMETKKKRLYIVGDGSGITQGIIASAVCGYRAAHAILNKN